jgi:hypothetical protein
MFRTIFTAGVAATILTLTATFAQAQQELDSNKPYASFSADAPKGAVILKVDTRTGEMSILNTDQKIASNEEAQKLAQSGTFQAIDSSKISKTQKSEVDQIGTESSWYFIAHGPRYYPTFAWGGVWAQPYYAYNYNYCNYYYYGSYPSWNTGWYGNSGWNGQVPYVNNVGYGFGWGVQPVYNYPNYVWGGGAWGGNWGGYANVYRGGYAGGYRGGYGNGFGFGYGRGVGYRGGYGGRR